MYGCAVAPFRSPRRVGSDQESLGARLDQVQPFPPNDLLVLEDRVVRGPWMASPRSCAQLVDQVWVKLQQSPRQEQRRVSTVRPDHRHVAEICEESLELPQSRDL